jgi:uncharacterized protein YjbI with pentapeptide repeats
MKIIITLILSALFLTSCSNPDTSGGVELSRGGGDNGTTDEFTYTANFPHGSCIGPTESGVISQTTGCGWFSTHGSRYYIMPGVKLASTKLSGANLSGANLRGAYLLLFDRHSNNTNLAGANLSGAEVYGWFVHTNLAGCEPV